MIPLALCLVGTAVVVGVVVVIVCCTAPAWADERAGWSA